MAAQNEVGGKFTIDINDLKAGITEANRLMRLADSEFKAAAAGLGDWTKSADGLTAKANQLNRAIDVQQAKIDALEKEYSRVAEAQGENSAAAQNLRIRINNETAAREKNKKALEDVAEALKDVDDAADDADGSTSGFGETMKSVAAGGVKAMATALVGLTTAFLGSAEATREYRTEMGKLDAAFTSMGHSSKVAEKAYEELYGIIGETDQSVEAAQQIALLAKSEEDVAKWAGLASGVVSKFGDALQPEMFFESANETLKLNEATGGYVQMLEGAGRSVDDFNAGLAKCKTEAEKQAYMLSVTEEVLGKSGAAYEKVNKDIIEANKAQNNLNEAMAGVGELAEPVMTKLKNMAADTLTSFTSLFDGFGDVMNGTTSFGEWGSEVITKIKESVTNSLPQLIESGKNMLESLGNGLKQNIPVFLGNALDMLLSFTSSLKENAPQLIESGMDFIRKIVQGLMNSLPELIAKVPTIVSNIARTITSAMPVILAKGIEIIWTIIKGLVNAIPTLIKNIPKIIMAIVDTLMAFGWLSLGKRIITFLSNGIKGMVGSVTTSAKSILDGIVNTIKGLPQKLYDLAKSAISRIGSALSGTGSISSAAGKIVTAVTKQIKSLPGKMKSIGKDVVKGLWNGINNMTSWVIKKIKGFGKSVLSGIKDFFGIKSPSRVMRDQVGKMLAEGIGVGFDQNIGGVMKNVKAALNPALDITGASGGTVGGTTINFTQNNHSPKALSPYEVYRQTKIANKLVTVR